MSDSVQPYRRQPTRLCLPWDSLDKNTGVGCHCLLQCTQVKSESEFAQSCPTLHDPIDCSLPDSCIHGIFQARVLEWGAIAFSMDVRVGPLRRLNAKELMLLNCDVGGRLFRVPWTARRPNQSILKEINPEWIFIGRTDAEDEATLVWPPDVKNWITGKDPEAGKDWGQEEKGATKDEMAQWHHQLNGHESEQTSGDSEGQGSLAPCSPWGQTWLTDWTTNKSSRKNRKKWVYLILPRLKSLRWPYF